MLMMNGERLKVGSIRDRWTMSRLLWYEIELMRYQMSVGRKVSIRFEKRNERSVWL